MRGGLHGTARRVQCVLRGTVERVRVPADATALATPLTLADAGPRSAPQSFAYIDESSTSSALADALAGLTAIRT